MNNFNVARRLNGRVDFRLTPPLGSSIPAEQDRNVYFEESMASLNYLQTNWDLPIFGELPNHEIEKPLSTGTSLSSDQDGNFFNLVQPENIAQLLEERSQVSTQPT